MKTREERDSLGPVQVPEKAVYGAQTQRAVMNFPVSGLRFGRPFIRALGLIKQAAAEANAEFGVLDARLAAAVARAAGEVANGQWDDQFPVDVFQTGSGTSTNMNVNEVIAALAGRLLGPGGARVHPNDHVNRSQSSNDVFPSAIHVAAYLEIHESLLPALRRLEGALEKKAAEFQGLVKTGRTHLMDALPVRLGQEFSGYAAQIAQGVQRIESVLSRLAKLALGGTAVGTGVNAPEGFGRAVAARLATVTGLPFVETDNHFAAQAAQDTVVELSGQLRTLAVALSKIATDLRWMNSGPQAGLDEVRLPALQPGSSLMPGKVNPVLPEVVAMVAAQVMGNDVTIAVAGQAGNFELNVMLPVMAHNLLESLRLLANSTRLLADRAVVGLRANGERMARLAAVNPMLVTALTPVIGYDAAAEIAQRAAAEGRSVRDVARELTVLGDEELDRLLDPRTLT